MEKSIETVKNFTPEMSAVETEDAATKRLEDGSFYITDLIKGDEKVKPTH